jgi:EAL domain-containing protein (putative c-di-GMP-specific phosphodiesterase class I)
MKTDLAAEFCQTLEKYSISPSKIHLEITEAAIVDDDVMKNQIDSLLKHGFIFSLDDYGTGYSNVSRLKHSPFSNVKIDMSLVWDYCSTPDIVLPMLIKTFKQSGYSITAEGIESKEIEEAMKSIGCDYLQGMYYSPPIPMDEFVEKYTKNS